MSIKLLVRQGGGAAAQPDFANLVPREGTPIFDQNVSLIEMGQRWEQGQAAQGSFKFVDPTANSGYHFRPHASVKLIENAGGSDIIIAWNRIEGGVDTGRNGPYIAADDVEHDIQAMDANIDLRGLPFKNGWSRPAEDSWERLQALHLAKLNGSSSTEDIRRSTTDITVDRFSNGHLVDATTPVDLDAVDYPAGTEVEDVLRDIMEQWGKGWGVTLHHVSGVTHKCLLIQDYDDLAKFTSALRISDQPADWDPDDLTAPTLEPHWRRSKGKTSDNSETISGLISIWGGTNDDPRHLYVETGEAPEDWETFVGVFNDDTARNVTQATRRANTILNDRKIPYTSHQPSILLNPEQVHLITAGQAIETRSVVMRQGPNRHDWTWRRITEIRWEPNPDGRWWAHLELERPTGARFGGPGGGAGQPKSTSPKPAPDCVPPGTEVLHDHIDPDDDACWLGSYVTSDGDPFFDSFCPAKSVSSPGGTVTCADGGAVHTLWSDLTPGNTYGFSIDIANKGVVADGKSFLIQERDAADVLLATHSFPIGARANYTKFTISGSFGALNASFDHAHFVWPAFFPKWYRNVQITETTAGSEVEGCYDYPPGTEPGGDCDDQFYLSACAIEAELAEVNERIDAIASAPANATLQQAQVNQRFPIWGHRGDIGSDDSLPENTLEGVRQCALKGIQGAEIDVRLSSDGTFHLMHDETVDRTTDGTGAIASLTDAAIAALNIDGGFGYISGSYDVPTLVSVFDALNPYDFVLSIQLNASSDANATALAELVVANGWTHRCLIEVSTLTEAAAVKAVSQALTVMVNNDIAGADADANVDWLSMVYTTVTSLSVTTGKAPQHVKAYISIADFPADETPIIADMWDFGVSAYQTSDVDFALAARNALLFSGGSASGAAGGDLSGTYPNPSVVDDSHNHTAATLPASSGVGKILITDTPAGSPLIFADLLQNDDGTDLLYADL